MGFQTHFDAGYPLSLFAQIKQLGPDFIRDNLDWKIVETTRNVYDFSRFDPYMAAAQQAGIQLFFGAVHQNALYDDGFFPYTPAGRQAFVNYVLATLEHYPQISLVEVENEPDSNTFMNGPAWFNSPYYYSLLLNEVYAAVKAKYPSMPVYGGVLSAPGIPYIRELTAWGGNAKMDIFSLHTYAWDESLLIYFDEVLTARGGHYPKVACTEWGQVADPGAVARGLILQASNPDCVASSWYQGYGDDTSLMTASGLTTNGNVWAFIKRLIGSSVPIWQRNSGDMATFIYELSPGTYAIWGRYGQALTISGSGLAAFDMQGNSIAVPTAVAFEPVILRNCTSVSAQKMTIDNSRVNHGTGNWSYLFHRADGTIRPATLMQYGPDLYDECWGDATATPYAQITNTNTVEPYGVQPILRWTAPAAYGALNVVGYVLPNARSTGAVLTVSHNGTVISTINSPSGVSTAIMFSVTNVLPGNILDFEYAAVDNNPNFANYFTELNIMKPA